MTQLRRQVRARPLNWRSPWTLLLGVLAAFQAGVIVTLLWTSGGTESVAPPPITGSAAGDELPAGGVVEPAREPLPPAPLPSPPLPVPPPPTPPVIKPDVPPTPAAPRLREVEIVSEPEGATVRIGGAVWGVTPLSAFLPTTAPLRIHVELDGYRPTRLTWSPSSGKRQIEVALEPLSQP